MNNTIKYAIKAVDLGKMYKIFTSPRDRITDALGLSSVFSSAKNYKEFWAIRKMSFLIPYGERIGIIGRNGAGKSTLLKIITGNISATEGKVETNGKIQALMQLGTGFHPEFTGRENIRTSLAYNGVHRKDILELEEEIIDFSELWEFIDQPVKTYSAGMYARLAFSTATSIKPEILIIDEVLGAGDAYFSGKSIERMRKLTSDSGATVLFVSHDLASVQALCEKAIWIDRGKVVTMGDTLDVVKQYAASVRHDEEIRLLVKDMKISKNHAVLLDRDTDIFTMETFRLIGFSRGGKQKQIKIRTILLYCDENEVGRIDIGAPMDNNGEYHNYILDDTGLMNWGTAEQDAVGYYRWYGDFKGKYNHAPFVFSIPKDIYERQPASVLTLVLNGEGEYTNIRIERYNHLKQEYTLLGEIDFQDKRTSISFYPDFASVEKLLEMKGNMSCTTLSNDQSIIKLMNLHNTNEATCKVINFELFDNKKKSGRVFAFSQQMAYIHVAVELSKPKEQLVFSLLIYTARGECLQHMLHQSILDKPNRFIELEYNFTEVWFASGEYSITFAVYDQFDVMDNTREQPALVKMDRSISFVIENRLEYNINQGLVSVSKSPRISCEGKEVEACTLNL